MQELEAEVIREEDRSSFIMTLVVAVPLVVVSALMLNIGQRSVLEFKIGGVPYVVDATRNTEVFKSLLKQGGARIPATKHDDNPNAYFCVVEPAQIGVVSYVYQACGKMGAEKGEVFGCNVDSLDAAQSILEYIRYSKKFTCSLEGGRRPV